jgi:hypothetical protein
MPRSRARIRADNRAIERGRTIVRKGLEGFTGKHQATAIAERVHGNAVLWGKLENDRPLARYLTLEGLKILIRDALAEWGFSTSRDDPPPQLELFPPDEQDVVKQIALARIWVPSRNAHIPYHDAPPETLEESSAYYVSLGRGINRKGVLLGQLAAIRRGRAA